MVVLANNLNIDIEAIERCNYSGKSFKSTHSQHLKPSLLLQAILEGLVDGVLILTEQGEWVHANECARRICQQFSQGVSTIKTVPQPIWQVCQSLLDSRELFPDRRVIIEDEIDTDTSSAFRIRVRWLVLEESVHPYVLVTLEDRHQLTQNSAIADARKYGLTPREAEVWLLRQTNHSYKEISDKLYITLNTVKKHMKNIYAKQQDVLWAEESEENSHVPNYSSVKR